MLDTLRSHAVPAMQIHSHLSQRGAAFAHVPRDRQDSYEAYFQEMDVHSQAQLAVKVLSLNSVS
jgi:hypothetical protein